MSGGRAISVLDYLGLGRPGNSDPWTWQSALLSLLAAISFVGTFIADEMAFRVVLGLTAMLFAWSSIWLRRPRGRPTRDGDESTRR